MRASAWSTRCRCSSSRVLAQARASASRARGSAAAPPSSASPARSRGATRRARRRRWRSAAHAPSGSPRSQPRRKPGHERVAGAEHVEHLDREARAGDAVVEPSRDRAGEDDAAHRPALHHERRRGQRAQARAAPRACRSLPPAMWISSSVPTTRSHCGEHRLQMRADRGRRRRSAARRGRARSGPTAPGGSRCRARRACRPRARSASRVRQAS